MGLGLIINKQNRISPLGRWGPGPRLTCQAVRTNIRVHVRPAYHANSLEQRHTLSALLEQKPNDYSRSLRS